MRFSTQISAGFWKELSSDKLIQLAIRLSRFATSNHPACGESSAGVLPPFSTSVKPVIPASEITSSA